MHNAETTGQSSKAFLSALQLADSFFPAGMYAHSHGLEGMVSQGLVATVKELAEFLKNHLRWSLMPSDGVALLNAYQAAAEGDLQTLISIDHLLLALKLPQEMRTASTQIGHRLMTETSSFIEDPGHADYRARVVRGKTPGNAAVAMGVTGWALGIPDDQTLLLFCHSHAVSVLGAAIRLLPLTHTDVQTTLYRLGPVITDLAGEIEGVPWPDMRSFTPELDISMMEHETSDLRLFAS